MSWRLLLFLFGMAMLMACSSDQTARDNLPPQAMASPTATEEPPTPEPEPAPATAVLNTGVPTQVVPIPASPTVAPTVSPVATSEVTNVDRPGRIAYVSSNAEIFTINPDGSNPQRISPGNSDPTIPTSLRPRYTWPGWAPDGKRVLYSSIASPSPGVAPFMLLSTMADGSTADRPDILFQNQYDTIGVVEGGPHYSLWSPDGKKLASVVGTPTGLVLALFDTEDKSFLTLPLRAPMYFGWSPDSERLAVHGSRKLQIIDDLVDGEFSLELEGGSSRYFAPQFAPDGERIAFLTEDDGAFFLNVHQLADDTDTPVITVEGFVWFRWSPDGETLAVLKGDSQAAESEIWLVAADGTSERLLARGRYQMFMWSPDGEKLLLSEVDKLQPFRAHWTVIDVDTGEIAELATFTPTLAMQQMILFFDQYSASHTLWSPDGQSIVFAGVLHSPIPDEGVGAGSVERIWVVDIDGGTPPRAIADGSLAFWSPQ